MIRELTRDDITPQYLELLCQLSGDVKEDVKTWLLGAKFWSEYGNSDCQIYIYEHEGEIVGTATVFTEHKLLHYGSRVGHIEDVVVNKDKRLKGVGKELISKCVEFAKRMHCYKVILDCADHNIPFYESCGFKVSCNCMRVDL